MILQIVHTKDTMSQIYLDALAIRNTVFIGEQGVSLEREIDQDEAEAIHFVLYIADPKRPVATVRLLPVTTERIKIQRMAVLKEYRHLQLGSKIVHEAESFAKSQGYQTMTLGAQLTARSFYEKLGYKSYGDIFMDADMEHIEMKKEL